ncbi:hypothetical protein OQA88_10314 [Cercophora sp. LCS_1]
MSSTARPSSAVSRPSSARSSHIDYGTLALAQPAFFNKSAAATQLPEFRKRKREDGDLDLVPADHLLKAPVVLKQHPAKLTAKPHILHPLMLLPREHLPLSTLDLAQPHGDLPASRFFESKIKILDLEGRLGSNVLLGRSETTRVIYAIERDTTGLYALCKLGSWVDVEELSQKATVVCGPRLRSCKPVKAESGIAPPTITPQMHKENKRRRLAIEEIQSIVQKRSLAEKDSQSRPPTPGAHQPISEKTSDREEQPTRGLSVAPTSDQKTALDPTYSTNGDQVDTAEAFAQPSSDKIFQNIRSQYFEALYHSMGSLAYFAKGPLSKARAAFHLDYDSNLEMGDLIDFLRSLVMTTILIDRKYRETVPDIIDKASAHDDSDHDSSKPKKRKSKKPKLGKDGLYPCEDEHVRRWWAANKPAAVGDDETTITTSERRYHISCLRRRETQLQIILILEILALQPLRRVAEAAEESQLPGMESQPASRDPSQEPAPKRRNRTNLSTLLDVHVDRLCIWQSTMTDETRALAESQVLPNGEHDQKSERSNDDLLRDFCVDIIIPFFSARLPELCDSINRKLGGPVVQSTPKQKSAKVLVPSKSKPGAPAKRPASLKKDKERTLERVLSKERMRRSVSRGPSTALALMRSASVTHIPGLKREGSEPLMSMIPKRETSSLKEKPSNLASRNAAFGIGEDARAKKKALVEAELKDAISALKKPNRALAVKELVEAAEKRVSTLTQPPKKLKKQSRVSAVQVKATPANNRFKDVLAADSTHSGAHLLDAVPSSASVIPSSTMPRRFANMVGAARSAPMDSIQATPARVSGTSSTIPRPASGVGVDLPSSPVMTRKAAPPFRSQPPAPSGRQGGKDQVDLPSSPGLAALFETPTNPRSNKQAIVNDTPIKARLFGANAAVNLEQDENKEGGGVAKGLSIYERLGWDTTDLDVI